MRPRTFGVSALALVILMMLPSAARATSSRIAFVSDRGGDLDVWMMREDGTNATSVTSETGDAHNPSITRSGQSVIYDFENDLYLVSVSGGTPQKLTGSGTGPCSHYGGTDDCMDPEAGALVFGGAGDFRIVFMRHYHNGSNNVTEIWMATVDVSEGTLVNFAQLTEAEYAADTHRHPAWCGNTHVVWDQPEPPPTTGVRDVCIMGIDAYGPVGSEVCYFTNDANDEQPACNSDGSKMALARAGYGGPRDIWVMDCDGTTCDDEHVSNLTEDYYGVDDFHPVWAPSGTQIAFASDRGKLDNSSDDDLDIWRMDASGSNKTNLTDDDDGIEDTEPYWGGATQ